MSISADIAIDGLAQMRAEVITSLVGAANSGFTVETATYFAEIWFGEVFSLKVAGRLKENHRILPCGDRMATHGGSSLPRA